MHNVFSYEVEVEFRRSEWQREITADAQTAQVSHQRGSNIWLHLPRLILVRLLQRGPHGLTEAGACRPASSPSASAI